MKPRKDDPKCITGYLNVQIYMFSNSDNFYDKYNSE